MPVSLSRVSSEARACTLCKAKLPFEPKPVFLVGRRARLLIVGQAPGRRVHETGIPWNDPSGDVLRAWLGLERARFRAALPDIRLTLLVGSYAQAYYLKGKRKKGVGETVRAFRDYLPEFFVLPHPSWRNKAWLAKNPWFADEVIPALRRRVRRCIGPL
jgi:uracil-DNA glycosylase